MRETQDQAAEAEEQSRGVALRGFESHPPHQTSSPNLSPILNIGASETDFDVYKHEKRFQNALRNLEGALPSSRKHQR